MSVAPVRPVTAGEVAVRLQLAPDAAQVLPAAPAAPVRPGAGPTAPVAQPQADAASAPTPPLSPTGPEAAATRALGQAVQSAVTRQAGAAPLLADLAQALRSSQLPAPVRAAVAQVLAAQPALGPAATPAEVRQALSRSGLFLEARLAALIPARGAPAARLAAQVAPGADAKAGLVALKGALAAWLAAHPKVDPPPPAPYRPTPPPYRDGPLQGQPPAQPSFPADAPPGAIAHRLSQEIDAALARHELMQAASLPDARRDLDGPRWNFETPVQTPAGDGLARFEVSRDGAGPGAPDAAPVWRARFSIDVEPLGPVHVQLALTGGRAQVGLWAERGEGAEQLRQATGGLAAALSAVDMPAEILVHEGQPPAAPAPAGAFVERKA